MKSGEFLRRTDDEGPNMMFTRFTMVAALCVLSRAPAAEMVSLSTHLDQAQVVGTVTPVPGASGDAIFLYDTEFNRLTWSVRFDQLSGQATALHFHGPASPAAEADVTLDIGGIGGLGSPSTGSATLTAQQEVELLSGQWYLNVHTAQNGSGEIRGQVLQTIPRFIAFSGLLRNAAGEPVTANQDFRFRIFNAEGAELWNEEHTLPVLQGVYAARLGSRTLLDPEIVSFSQGYFLQIEVRNAAGDFEIVNPRTTLSSSPYALRAGGVVDGSISSASLARGSVTATRIAGGAVTTAALADNSVTSSTIVDGEVKAVDLDNNSVTSEKIVDATVDTADLKDESVTSNKIEEKSINPLVHLDRGNAFDGAYLTFNEGLDRWEAGVLIVGPTFLAPGGASDGDVLTFSSAAGHWQPEPLPGVGSEFELPFNGTHDGSGSALRIANPGDGPAGEFAGGLVVHGQFNDGAPTRALGVSNDTGAHTAIFSNDCNGCSTPVLELQGSTSGPLLFGVSTNGGIAQFQAEGLSNTDAALNVVHAGRGPGISINMLGGNPTAALAIVNDSPEGMAASMRGDVEVNGNFQGNGNKASQAFGFSNVGGGQAAIFSNDCNGCSTPVLELQGSTSGPFLNIIAGLQGTAARFEGGANVFGFLQVDPQTPDASAAHFQGGVSIGGTLSVSGSIKVNDQTLEVPDYVFEPDYPLLPLDDLLAFVHAERHLPDIPSKDDADGWYALSLQDRDMRLLQKVEELTLYIGQLQARIKALERQVAR